MATEKKKSDDINGNYPLIGWRLKKKHAEAIMKLFKEVEKAWNDLPSAPTTGYKRNDLFLKAMQIGLVEMKKNIRK